MDVRFNYTGDMVTDLQLLDDYHDCMEDVQKYIRNNMDDDLNREKLAEIAGFSVPHFHRIFIGCTGESMAAYVRRQRMIRAGQKLRMGAVDITEVALAAGYQTHAAFGKAFKQYFGISPSAFRELSFHQQTFILRQG